MIEYDYKIVRDEKDEKVTFLPSEIPRKLDNLVYIEGPNSSGKSTLLHILALSLHGLKNESIHPALRNKMSNLFESKHQNLTFKVSIIDKTGNLKIESEKKDPLKPEIKVYEYNSGKKTILTPELFERKYYLIYDIPDNPTERLNQLTDEIKDAQTRYGNRLGVLNGYIRQAINDIQSAGDPNRLINLKKEREKLLETQGILSAEINSFENELKSLKYATYSKYFYEYKQKSEWIENKLEKFEQEIKKTEKKQKSENKKFSQSIEALQINIKHMQELFDQITELLKKLIPKENDHKIKMWERINLSDAYNEYQFDDNLEDLIISFEYILSEEYKAKSSQEIVQEAQMYRDLIKVLENYKNLNITLPGLQKSISVFISDIKKDLIEKEQHLKHLDNLSKLQDLLKNFNTIKKLIESRIFPEIKKLKQIKVEEPVIDSKYDVYQKEISDLKTQLKDNTEILKYYEGNLNLFDKTGFNTIPIIGKGELDKYSIYTEKQLNDEISKLDKIIKERIGTFNKNKYHIERFSKDIEDLEKREPHKYQKFLKELNELFSLGQNLEQKIKKKFADNITAIKGKKEPKNEDQKNYNEALFIYLGKRLNSIRHIDKEYFIEKIDLIKGVIKTNGGKEIWLSDMGTGQSQAAYLKSLLSASDNRIIIALFDEVAMMDQQSLSPIFEKFRELYNKKQLLIGIVVQKADKVQIISKL